MRLASCSRTQPFAADTSVQPLGVLDLLKTFLDLLDEVVDYGGIENR